MRQTCQVIPFPAPRTAATPRTASPSATRDAKRDQIVALLRESLPPGAVELIEAFRGLPPARRAALIGMARAAAGDRREQNQAIDRLYATLTPAERLHLDAANGKLNTLIAAFAEKGD